MRFRNPFLNWIAEHPTGAVFALVGITLLLLTVLPILLYMTPIRKVPLIYNLRNLQNRWKTTLATALAFTLVTFLLTGMLSFVKGMDRLVAGSGSTDNIMILSDGSTDEAFSNLPNYALEELPGDVQKEVDLFVKEVYVVAMYMIPDAPVGARQRRFVQLRGLDNPEIAAEIHGVKLAPGHRWPSDNNTKEVVIGHGVARAFGADVGKEMLEPGDVVTLGDPQWTVVGVMEEGSGSFASEIWARAKNVQDNFGRENSYTSYVVRLKNPSPEKAKQAVQTLKDPKIGRSFQAFSEREYYAKMNDTSKQFSAASWVVAFIMAIGGILGIMNTMYAAISQRSKDIGVLRLMGYRRWQILLSFQFESMLIAILGGLLGLIVAYLAFEGRTVTSIITSGPGGPGKTVVLKLTYDLQVFISGAIFALLMGSLGGFIPAVSAMRLRPLESLK